LKNRLIIGAVILLAGCDFLKMKESGLGSDSVQSVPVARVHTSYLYAKDLEGLVAGGITPEDSASRVERYVNHWIRKQLFIDEASTKIDIDEAEIQRKILDYRYSLLGYEYRSFYINENLNKVVTEEEIQLYYEQNLDNFPLKQNVIRGQFVKVPKEAPKINELRKWMKAGKQSDQEQLKEYCLTFATLYSVQDSIWINFDDIIKNTPLAELPNKIDFISKNKYTEFNDDQSLYFLRINEYKITNDISPLEVVYDQIKNIIINKRKVELAKNLEEDIYERAKGNEEFEIFN